MPDDLIAEKSAAGTPSADAGRAAVPEATAASHAVDTATGAEAEAQVSMDRARSIFTKIARRYSLFNALSSFGIYKVWLRRTVKRAQAKPTDEVLDLAAGTGDVTYRICRDTPPARIACTDFTPAMLDIAKSRQVAESNGVPLEFMVVDAQDIPYPDESFDLVTIAYGIRNIPDREKALCEAYRVLRPGGRFVILEFSTPSNPVWRVLYHAYLNVMIPFIGGLLTHDRPGFVYLKNSINAFPDQEGLASLLRAAGFDQVTYENCTGGITAIHQAIK